MHAAMRHAERFCWRKTKVVCMILLPLRLCVSSAVASEQLRSGKPEDVGMEAAVLQEIDAAVERALKAGEIPGCVVLVARKGTIVWEKAYGYRSLTPHKETNSVRAIYDLASLTKPFATAAAFALLLEDGKLDLRHRVADYLPSFAQNDKSDITLADLLIHVSGLRPYLDVSGLQKKYGPDPNPDAVISDICALPKTYETGKSCVYSCLNFLVLARVIEEVCGEPMHSLLDKRVWRPIGMKNTGFFLSEKQRKRAAPTLPDGSPELRGEVHDPLARYYLTPGRSPGNAGLFSTAHDLAVFSQMLLNRGTYGGLTIFKPETVDLLTAVHTPPDLPKRALGWDIDSPYSRGARGEIIPETESFGHTGFTGCSVWIDKNSQTFFILLANRTHLPKGDVLRLRSEIANIVGRSIDIYREKPGVGDSKQ